MIDEQPALRELDEVIASAQRSASARTSASPEHAAEEYVDAADIFQVDEAMQLDEKITHVDRVVSKEIFLSWTSSRSNAVER